MKITDHNDNYSIIMKYINSNPSGMKRIMSQCLCPFHEEKTPSCLVRFDTDEFHCFGCGKDGTLKELREQIERLHEMDKLKEKEDEEALRIYWGDTKDSVQIYLKEINRLLVYQNKENIFYENYFSVKLSLKEAKHLYKHLGDTIAAQELK